MDLVTEGWQDNAPVKLKLIRKNNKEGFIDIPAGQNRKNSGQSDNVYLMEAHWEIEWHCSCLLERKHDIPSQPFHRQI